MTRATRERVARVALGHLVEPGTGPFPAGTAGERLAGAAAPDGWPHHRAAGEIVAARLSASDPYDLAERALREAERFGARIITPDDDEWPAGLGELPRLSRTGRTRSSGTRIHHTACGCGARCRWPRRATGRGRRRARSSTAYGDHVATQLGFALVKGAGRSYHAERSVPSRLAWC
jgi:DNA processing protein